MEFIADLHIHSYLSRATAKNLNLEHLNLWSQLKGITVVATGDFTHPQWFRELSKKLEPAEEGLYSLKPAYAAETAPMVPSSCRGQVRFILTAEISSIYKKDGKTRKVHNVIFAPTLDVVESINQKLSKIGNVASDGRPILGLDCKRLLEMVLETSEDAFLIPAHIWTPWFSVLGSKSGFDAIEECFEELTPHIFAVETGLSSDPAMNWRVSSLDDFTLVSNSDAHSPANLGREANLFDTALSYFAMRDALRSGDPERFLGTLEYFAEEGKYHFDGHRKCGTRFAPGETLRHGGLCPVCGKPVTIGVMYRVEELADREPGERPEGAHPYTSLLPLTDILAEVFRVGPKTKKVSNAFWGLIEKLGPEFEILRKTSVEDLDRYGPPLAAEAIRRMRHNEVHIAPGYDGEFGTVCLFEEEERIRFGGQKRLFKIPSPRQKKARKETAQEPLPLFRTPGSSKKPQAVERVSVKQGLNEAQQKAVEHEGPPLMIVAGPGTGKTFTLASRIARLIRKGDARPEQILAVTFTNKAAQEMSGRLSGMLGYGGRVPGVTVQTFHGLCFDIITAEAGALGIKSPFSILNEADRPRIVQTAMETLKDVEHEAAQDPVAVSDLISKAKQLLLGPDADLAVLVPQPLQKAFPGLYRAYEGLLQESRLLDFDDLIVKTVRILETDPALLRKYQKRFQRIFIDEYQDINYAQYRLIRLLAPKGHDICVIGDPDQAIYGFRGADVRYFHSFCDDFPGAETIRLRRNYRSTETILKASGQLIRVEGGGSQEEGVWSGIHGAKALTVTEQPTERAEAEYIVKTIEQEVGGITHFSMDSGRVEQSAIQKERSFSDFAVLYRIKGQARALEEAFGRSGIPYQMVGHEKLQDRKGIRELLSYLRVARSVASDFDVERILNFPKRGIGRETARAFSRWSRRRGFSLLEALGKLDDISQLKPGQRKKLKRFAQELSELRTRLGHMTVYEQVSHILDQFRLREALGGIEAFEEDVAAVLGLSKAFGNRVVDFLAHLALQKPEDCYDPQAEKVCLLTMHAAKGLEFPVVFVAGCEDGLVPYHKKGNEPGDLEEEKRLFYVALTRAQEKIYLVHAKRRLLFGQRTVQKVSPFLETVEEDLKEYCRPSVTGRVSQRKNPQLSLFDLA